MPSPTCNGGCAASSPTAADRRNGAGIHRRPGRADVRQHEPAGFGRLVGILRDATYRGYLVLECEEEDRLVAIPRHIGRLRELLR